MVAKFGVLCLWHVLQLSGVVYGFGAFFATQNHCHHHQQQQQQQQHPRPPPRRKQRHAVSLSSSSSSDAAAGDSSSYMVTGFNTLEELDTLVQLARRAIPDRPDGIVVVVKYSSFQRDDCQATEAEYDRAARTNPASLFLRCWEDDPQAAVLLQQVDVRTWPTIDVFYQGSRVARLEGPPVCSHDLDAVLNRYQVLNSTLDLFSEQATPTTDRNDARSTQTTPPRTTARFLPASEGNTAPSVVAAPGDDPAPQSFEDTFENWLPNIEDE